MRKRITRTDRLIQGVLFEQKKHYYNNLERLARLLELRIYFWGFEHKDPHTINNIKNRQNGGYKGNVFIIPDCHFGCGSAPCICSENWEEYKMLENQLQIPGYGKGAVSSVRDIIKDMDKNWFYRRVKN